MKTADRIAAGLALAATVLTSDPVLAGPIKNIVLVHGFFADGSGWRGIADLLTRDGYRVVVVQQPETSFADDVQATKRAVDSVDGNSILVGHSYGGAGIQNRLRLGGNHGGSPEHIGRHHGGSDVAGSGGEVGGGEQLQQDVLDVLTDVSRLG